MSGDRHEVGEVVDDAVGSVFSVVLDWAQELATERAHERQLVRASRTTTKPTHRDVDLEQVVQLPVLVVLGPPDLPRHRLPTGTKAFGELAGQGSRGGSEAVDLGPRAPLTGEVGRDVDLHPSGMNDGACPADQLSYMGDSTRAVATPGGTARGETMVHKHTTQSQIRVKLT